MKRDFKKVKKWNMLMGVKTPDNFQFPIEAERDLASNLIIEETDELWESETKEEVLDALADIKFVLYGAAVRYGITAEEFEEYFAKVCKSNDSKFANTEQDAIDSITKESERLNISESDISYNKIDDKYVIFNKVTGKILKSINYREPSAF